ncbi:MAG: hypothetical protein LBK58_09270 [Prevotellaceae bacterium]|jgi:hypothetical protein|nr:hypothetical protein [Prevotellaceae bacterium]
MKRIDFLKVVRAVATVFPAVAQDRLQADGVLPIVAHAGLPVTGDFWLSSMSDRRVSNIEYYPEYTLIRWESTTDVNSYVELEYDGVDGKTETLKVLPGETEIYLWDAVQGFAHLRYRSVYAIAGSTIYSDWLRYSPRYMIYPIGDASPYVWIDYNSVGVPAPTNNPNVYDFEINLGRGYVRFLTASSFSSIQLWPDGWSLSLPGEGSFQFNPNVSLNWMVTEAGLYHIHLDLNELIYKIELK